MLDVARYRLTRWLGFLHDFAAVALAWCLAYLLRFNLEIPQEFLGGMLESLAIILPAQAAVLWAFGLYRGMWRFTSLADLKSILIAGAVAAAAAALLLFVSQRGVLVPRSVLILDPLILVMLMSGSRLAYRYFHERRLQGLLGAPLKPVIVLGAGVAAEKLITDLGSSQEWKLVALLDDDPGKRGRDLHGIRVLGALRDLPQVVQSTRAQHAIIAMPSAAHAVRRRAAELCAQAGVSAMTVPAIDDLVSGKVTVSQIRSVELDDLLGRDPVALDSAGLRDLLDGKVVLVTGAGGSIGAELCRQIARFAPARVVLFELSEYALYTIEQEFRDRHPGIAVSAVIGDAKDAVRVAQTFERFRPDVVFHAAAYKHVPLMEEENAWQAVQNNVLGTLAVARAAAAAGTRKFVLISTDKAVNPTNVMGATKRVAERICQAVQAQAGETTQFVIVRFGNVLGSTGSVIPRFRAQIAAGGPVTVTHPEIQRYFMSIPEASQLVLQAALMGAAGQIFVLDMGEPVRIADLARQLIRLSGFSESDIRIVYTGLRPGEKLYEELLADAESTEPTPHPKLRVARLAAASGGAFEQEIEAWLAGPALSDAETRSALRRWVPEYDPAAGGEGASHQN